MDRCAIERQPHASPRKSPGGRPKSTEPLADLHARFPVLVVLAGPERHGRLVVQDVAVLRVALQAAAGAVGDVAEVAKQGALVPFLDFAVEPGAFANGVEEISQVWSVAA